MIVAGVDLHADVDLQFQASSGDVTGEHLVSTMILTLV